MVNSVKRGDDKTKGEIDDTKDAVTRSRMGQRAPRQGTKKAKTPFDGIDGKTDLSSDRVPLRKGTPKVYPSSNQTPQQSMPQSQPQQQSMPQMSHAANATSVHAAGVCSQRHVQQARR